MVCREARLLVMVLVLYMLFNSLQETHGGVNSARASCRAQKILESGGRLPGQGE